MHSQEKVSEEVEEITKTPVQESKGKEKDPKKVAAGKKLAEYNRAKEALKEKMKREAEKTPEMEDRETVKTEPWIPELSFTTVISLFGIGLTAFDLFMRFSKKDNKPDPLPPRLPEPPSELPRPSKIPVPKMGMY